MGKHLCWTKDDWTHGLPMLAKGSDPELAAVAATDLAGAAEPAKQVDVGDAWWVLAETKQGEDRNAMSLRAGFWYRQAEPNVQAGLDRLKITQRLAEIAKLGRPIPGPAGPPLAVAPFDAAQARRHQAAWAAYLGTAVEFTNSLGMKLVIIPPGEFDMGSNADVVARLIQDAKSQKLPVMNLDELGSEAPRHRVNVTKPFCLGVHEVTQLEFRQVMGTDPSYFKGNPNCPVEMVTWNDALAFCRKLAELPQERGASAVYRLPTEAEWELSYSENRKAA